MPRRSMFGGKQEATGNVCGTCHERMPPTWWNSSREPPDVVHCEGSPVGWQTRGRENPHHGRSRYPDCWHCGYSLGCDQCGGVITEVLCVKCVVWGTKDAFLHHGPILNTPPMMAKRGGKRAPQTAEYPASWASAYRSQDRPELDYAGQPLAAIKDIDDANEDAV